MSENNHFNINNLVDIDTERSLLRALMEFDSEETVMALVRLKIEHFYDDGHQRLFDMLKELETRGFALTMQTVRTEVASKAGDLMDSLQAVALSDPSPAVLFAVDALEEWSKKRELFKGFMQGMQELQGGEPALMCANAINKVSDAVSLSSVDEFHSYAKLKEKIAKEPPIAKIQTGISFLDSRLKGGVEFGQFILLMGDPESGKTSLATQIQRNISNNFEVLFFTFEFHYRSYIEQNKINESRFSLERFLIEFDNNDILDVEAKIKIFAKRGGRVVLIDSQMMITNINNRGTSEERETEKFFILQRLCMRYGIIIIFICQQGKEDTRSGSITPKGTKNGAHAAHQIWYVKKLKPNFDADGNDENLLKRDFVMYKNKQTGVHFSKPMELNPRQLEFAGKQYDDDDYRSTRTVGTGNHGQQGRKPPPIPEVTEYVMEDENGNETTFDPGLFPGEGNIEMPNV